MTESQPPDPNHSAPGDGCEPDHRNRVRILDTWLDRVDLREAMARIGEACETKTPLQIVTVNLNFLTIGRRIPAFGEALNSAGLSVVDGRILQWATWLLGEPAPEQITGHDLFRESIKLAAERDYGIFLLGGAPGVASSVAEKLESEHPGLRARGTSHGRFAADGHAERQDELEEQILEFKPDLLFVALGAPKQDLWIANHCAKLNVPVAVGVGCVLDVAAGTMRRVPEWVQKCGLESPVQMLFSPRRYTKRYLIDDPPTLLRMAWYILRRRLLRRPRGNGPLF